MTLSSAAAPSEQKPGDPNAGADPKQQTGRTPLVALPLGGQIKMDPWSDKLEMLKSKPVGAVAKREKMPFEVTPFMLYLVREGTHMSSVPGAVSADSKPAAAEGKVPQQ
jgi:hypothetical protein